MMFRSLRGYRREWVRGDLVAGLTVWAVLVPEATLAAVVIPAVIELVDFPARSPAPVVD